MAREKTKELTEQVKELHEKQIEEMKALEEQRENAIKEEMFDEGAETAHNLYCSYIKAGFTEEQAWELLTISLKNAVK